MLIRRRTLHLALHHKSITLTAGCGAKSGRIYIVSPEGQPPVELQTLPADDKQADAPSASPWWKRMFLFRRGGPPLLLLLMLLLALLASPAFADGFPPTVTGTLTPDTPTYIDPLLLKVTVTDPYPVVLTGMLNYSVDGGSLNSAPVTNGSGVAPLGTYAPGTHTVTYQFVSPNFSSNTAMTTFTTVDLPFSFIGSEQPVTLPSGVNGMALDSSGIAYLTSGSDNNVYQLDLQHKLTIVPTLGLSRPQGIAVDADHDLIVVDSGNNRVIMVTPAGVQSTMPFTGLSGPTQLAFDRSFQTLYLNDAGNTRIVKLDIASGAQINVVSGIDRITGLAVNIYNGNLYFGQHYSNQAGTLFQLDTSGNITSGYFGARSVEFLTGDLNGNLYFQDDFLGVTRIDALGHLTHIEDGGGPLGVDQSGQIYVAKNFPFVFTAGTAAKLGNALSAGIGGAGNGNSAPSGNTVVYQVPYQQTLSGVDITAGGNGILLKGAAACEQSGQCSNSIAFGPFFPGNHSGYLVATLGNKATLRTNFYGTGVNSSVAFDPGGQTTVKTSLTSAGGLAEAEDHTLYVTDPAAAKVYSLGIGGASTPTALAFTNLTRPTQIAVDGGNNVFVLDGSSRILELSPAGVQFPVYSPAGGQLASVTAMALDGSGTLFIGGKQRESSNYALTVTVDGIETIRATVPAAPTLLALDDLGNLYEADASTSTLRRFPYNRVSGSLGAPVTVATGFSAPSAITVEPSGTVFLALGTAGTLLQVRPDGSTAALYSKLGNASAVVEDGRGVLTLVDGASGTLYLDDRSIGAYTFEAQQVGTTSPALPGTLSNDGNQTLAGIGALPGDNTFKQVVETGACTGIQGNAGTSLVLGGFCKLDYTFTPANPGTVNESLGEQDSTPSPSANYSGHAIDFAGVGIAAAPDASLTPAQVLFGNVPAGTVSPTQVVTLTNTGAGTLTLSSVTLTGSSAFAQANTCGTTLAPAASCTLTLRFSPTSTGQVTGTLTITDNAASGTTQTVALSGDGTAAPPTLTPGTASFATQAASTTSAPVVFTLTNPNAAAIQQTGFTITGSGAGQFQVASITCTATLAANSSCTASVVFLTGGSVNGGLSYSATLNVTAAGTSLTAALSGTQAAVAQAVLSPATANLGTVQIGQSSTQTLTLTNAGTASLPITSATVSSGPFALTGKTCSSILAAGASCTFTLAFIPTVTGTQTALFSVINSVGTQLSSLTALATAAPAPQAALTPATLSFGSIATNTTAPAQIVTLTNAGTATLTITSATLTGSGFTLAANTCSSSLAAGASCTFSISFTPVAAVGYAVTLVVVDSVGTQSSSLTGSGIAVTPPDFTINPTPAAQASYRGQSVSYVLAVASLSSANPFTGPVVLSASGLPSGATATFSPATVVPGSTSTLTVAVPALVGATYTIESSGIAFAALFFGLLLTRRKRLAPGLLLMALALATATATLSGCGTGNGFAIPTSTSLITITATSGTVVHSTTVTLTVK